MTHKEKIDKINELLLELKKEAVINVIDENGCETDLLLGCIESTDNPNELYAWCHSNNE
ncbi:hypothetical protein [Butyrivibrio sp. MC2021]|uniref:hypothetical protein n=1 Tax=Butyrivibrio sp. MC2021 TaxID=1408306 RepID=UPI0012DFE72A|nr:hypothetical protein [Butyrivibrio sp. MC2021]